MGRPKKSAPADVEPEEESQEIEEEEPEADEEEAGEPESAAQGGTIKKVDAVRNALAAGKDTPDTGTAYIRHRYGNAMANTQSSTVKSQLKKKEGGQPAKKAAAPRKRKPVVEGYVAPPPKARSEGEPDVLLALESVKELVETYGAEKVKRMVDLLG